MTEQTTVPEQTALQLAQTERDRIMGALESAVSMLEDQRRRRPAGLTVDDQAVLDGLRMARSVTPLLMAYADEVTVQRNVLAARVAGDDHDTTAATMLALVTGISAACAVPGPSGLTAPAQPLVGSLTAAWQAGAEAGWIAHAAFVLQRIAARLA